MWWYMFTVSLLLLSVNGQEIKNSLILVEKSTVKCVNEISSGQEEQSAEDFKWRPRSLSKVEPSIPLIIRKKCMKKQLALRLKIIDDPSSVALSSDNKEALLVVDNVENELIRGHLKSRLTYPLVLKVSQLAPSILSYPIKFLYRVNAQPYEEVISLNSTKDYAGCYFGPEATRPTCGSSVGAFCCSCNTNRGNKCTKPFSELSEVMQSSAHCLRFSPYWYGVYSLEKPQIYHQISLQIFKNEELPNGTTLWNRMFSEKNGVTLSTQKRRLSLNSVSVRYHDDEEESPANVQGYINVSTSRLLVPILNPVSVSEKSSLPQESLSTLNHPSLEKGSQIEDSLLLLSKSLIAPEGSECNRAGTSFPAFDQQQDPCNSPRNSCLTHQPLDLWKSGNHSIRVYGPVAKISSPIKFTPGGRDGVLLMENKINGRKTYFIDIEIDEWKDFNLLSKGYNPIFEFLVTDTSWNSGAKVTAKIINSERIASKFKIEVRNCPAGLSGQSEMKSIRPLQSETFVINLEQARNINETVECYVVILNEIQEMVGGRDVRFKDGDTCICKGRCKCVCVEESMHCDNLEWEGLVAAGLADWDEEMMDIGNGTYVRGHGKDHENEVFNEMDNTVTRWWYWSTGILGFPILAFFMIGMICWFFSEKWRLKSSLNMANSKDSFPEGDKRHFSISDDGDEISVKSSSRVLSRATSANSSKENQAKDFKRNDAMLSREVESPSLTNTIASKPAISGSRDDRMPLKFVESTNSHLVASSQQPSRTPSFLVQNPPIIEPRNSSRTMNSSTKVPDSKQSSSAISSYSDPYRMKSSSTMLPTGKSGSTVIETVTVHQSKASASESGNELGGDGFAVDLDDRKGLKLGRGHRYGSWHRVSAAASKSILELCEITSSSSESFDMNGNERPNPHYNYD